MTIAAFSLLTACEISTGAGEDGFGYEPDGFTVTFDSNGGTPVSPITGVQLYSTISKPTNPKTGYKFEGWYLNGKEWDFAIDVVIGNITLYAKWGEDFDGSFVLGETGLGGGKIFYVADGKDGRPFGFDMTDTGKKCYYLEAAPVNWYGGGSDPQLVWSSGTGTVGTGTDIGTGRKNTASIILKQSETAPAALDCRGYRGNNKDDWFLPSKEELNQLYLNKTHVGLGDSNNYWSSSEASANTIQWAWFQNSGNGDQDYNYKNNDYWVRPIRAF